MNNTLRVFHEVQLRHAKRMSKIMEYLLKFPDEHMVLDVLVAEEHQKRMEDYEAIMGACEATGCLKSAIENLAREVTDNTLVYLLQKQVLNLKAVRLGI